MISKGRARFVKSCRDQSEIDATKSSNRMSEGCWWSWDAASQCYCYQLRSADWVLKYLPKCRWPDAIILSFSCRTLGVSKLATTWCQRDGRFNGFESLLMNVTILVGLPHWPIAWCWAPIICGLCNCGLLVNTPGGWGIIPAFYWPKNHGPLQVTFLAADITSSSPGQLLNQSEWQNLLK